MAKRIAKDLRDAGVTEQHIVISATLYGQVEQALSGDRTLAQQAAMIAAAGIASPARKPWIKQQRAIVSAVKGEKLAGTMNKRCTQVFAVVYEDRTLAEAWARGDYPESVQAAYKRLFMKEKGPSLPTLDRAIAACVAGKWTRQEFLDGLAEALSEQDGEGDDGE